MKINPTQSEPTCPICNLEWDDHVVKVFRAHWTEVHPKVTPFSDQEEPTFTEDPMGKMLSSHIDVASGVVDVPLGAQMAANLPSTLPVLVFTFSGEEPITRYLVLDDTEMRSIPSLISDAVQSSLKQARRRR